MCTHTHVGVCNCSSLPLVAPASWVQHNKRPQRSARHDPRRPERGPVSLGPVRDPQARQHGSQGPLHHPERREPHRGLHDGREEEGGVRGLSRTGHVWNEPTLCRLFKSWPSLSRSWLGCTTCSSLRTTRTTSCSLRRYKLCQSRSDGLMTQNKWNIPDIYFLFFACVCVSLGLQPSSL